MIAGINILYIKNINYCYDIECKDGIYYKYNKCKLCFHIIEIRDRIQEIKNIAAK